MPNLRTFLRHARTRWHNRRHAGREIPPYVGLTLDGEVVELTTPLPLPRLPFIRRLPWPSGPTSVSELRQVFEQLAQDPRIRGVRLKIHCHADAAVFQSLRTLLLNFRAGGKRVVAYCETFGPMQYYLACACDQIVMPPSAEWAVLGIQNEYVFFKDALDELGIGVDLVRVSPFKSAGEPFIQRDFSEEARQQAQALLDARFDEIVRGIAEGRRLEPARVRELINQAPLSAEQAVAAGLMDAALYEDELEAFLEPDWAARPSKPLPAWFNRLPTRWQAKLKEALPMDTREPALLPLQDVSDHLVRPLINYNEKHIGVVRIEGTIVRGHSVESPIPLPFLESGTAGSSSIAQVIRQAEADKRMAAVILFVNSPGGDSLASDLIAREVRRLQTQKPVVVYMGGVAASGGYYVATLAQRIIAQPMTLTGSIGVFALKPNTQAAFGKLKLHRTLLRQGEHAGLFSDATPLSEGERAALEGSVMRAYHDFKQLVAEGRKLDYETLEPLCGGRVWTGTMAHERRLVDVLGDFTQAIEAAQDLAALPSDKKTRVVVVEPPREFVLPKPFDARQMIGEVTREAAQIYADLRRTMSHTRLWALLPFNVSKSD